MKQKWIAILLSAALILTLGAACGKKDDTNNANTNNGNGSVNDNIGNGGNTAVPNNPNTGNGMNNTPNSNPTPETNNGTDNSGSDMNGSKPGNYPVFPDALTTADADVAIDDLIDTLGLSERDLQTAMANMEAVGDDVTGKTYRHKLLGYDADVSYGFNDARDINKVTVRTAKEHADTWRSQLKDVLGATAVEGQTDSWNYSDSTVKMVEEGDHFIITIEKPQM